MSPDKRTLLSVLSACAMSGALDLVNLVHSWIDECGLGIGLCHLVKVLMDMYGKCGELQGARNLFDLMVWLLKWVSIKKPWKSNGLGKSLSSFQGWFLFVHGLLVKKKWYANFNNSFLFVSF